MNPIISRLVGVVVAFLLNGCATVLDNNDPLERYNRAMYSFNEAADKAVIKPIAKGYDAIVPAQINLGVSNFFSNLNDITVVINDVLQLKFIQALQDAGRFVINSTIGIGGLFDVASTIGYYKHNEDFGQTLGVWGVASGPYIVLPFFGSSTLRDSFGLVGDMYTDPAIYVHDDARYALIATRVIDRRAYLLGIEKMIEQMSVDQYTFIRDAWQQRRQYLIYDGNTPDEDEDFDVFAD